MFGMEHGEHTRKQRASSSSDKYEASSTICQLNRIPQPHFGPDGIVFHKYKVPKIYQSALFTRKRQLYCVMAVKAYKN